MGKSDTGGKQPTDDAVREAIAWFNTRHTAAVFMGGLYQYVFKTAAGGVIDTIYAALRQMKQPPKTDERDFEPLGAAGPAEW